MALQQLTAGLTDVETDAAGFPPSPVSVTCESVSPAVSITIQAGRSLRLLKNREGDRNQCIFHNRLFSAVYIIWPVGL